MVNDNNTPAGLKPTVVNEYHWYGDRPMDPMLETWEYHYEEWRRIKGEGGYWVSDLGRVAYQGREAERDDNDKVIKRARARRLSRWGFAGSKKVYPQVSIRGKRYLVHVLVAEAFYGPRPDGCEVDHLDGNAFNARANNLRYVTRAENVRARYDRAAARGVRRIPLPLQPEGYCSHGHKLTKQDLSVRSGAVCHTCLTHIYKRNQKQVLSFLPEFNDEQTSEPFRLPIDGDDGDSAAIPTQDDDDVVRLFDTGTMGLYDLDGMAA